jgi:hypothetical protein
MGSSKSNNLTIRFVSYSTPGKAQKGQIIMKINILAMAALGGFTALTSVKADDVQFVTLPDVVRTSVVREARLPGNDYSRITRVIRDGNGVYQITVHRDTDNYIVYVDNDGQIVREQSVSFNAVPGRPIQSVQTFTARQPGLTETVTETAPSVPNVETFVRSLNNGRYELIEKKDNKEVYRDRSTGIKWKVKVERDDD